MDYKAKYEEARERAKRWVDGTLQPERTTPQGVCETIFPELAEYASKFERKVAEIIFYRQDQDDWLTCLKLGKEYAKELLELAKQEILKEKEEVNLNDSVEVVLTKSGAECLNKCNEHKNKPLKLYWCKIPPIYKTDYKEGDVYVDQLWMIIQIFAKEVGLGFDMPFSGIKIIKR